MTPVHLRRATTDDIFQMRELERRTTTAAHWSSAQYDALFATDAQPRVALIAAGESTIAPMCGFLIARCLPDEWEIESVIVDEQHRQCGIGSLLVRELLGKARVGGARSVILEVRESNRPAQRLYESIGFKAESRRNGYYQGPTEDALLYRIRIAVL